MILSFSTKLNNKSTYFVEKIWAGIENMFAENTEEGLRYLMPKEYFDCLDLGFQNMKPFKSKLHTIREDKKNRWKSGLKIDFFINCRQPNMFRFAPTLQVLNVQKIEINWFKSIEEKRFWYKDTTISIDNRYLSASEVKDLALNDGFDSVEEFFNYFDNNFKGKIIHWTNLKY